VDAVFEVHGDVETNRHNPKGPMKDAETAAEWIQLWLADWERGGIGYFTVRTIEEPDRIIGFAGLKLAAPEGVEFLNLYYRFRPSVWGRGYAFEAVQAALDASRPPRCAGLPVLAKIREANVESRRLAERLGLRWDGVRFDDSGLCIYEL
jgi:[ribosomal protein S5]-alanine N-acetyltransferase